MTSRDDIHTSERQLVREAAVSEAARAHLKTSLLPHVVEATRAFMQSRDIPSSQEHTLVEAGMAPFEQVFSIYLKNAGDRDTEEGHFYRYYIWWMRQAIVKHLSNPSV